MTVQVVEIPLGVSVNQAISTSFIAVTTFQGIVCSLENFIFIVKEQRRIAGAAKSCIIDEDGIITSVRDNELYLKAL